jgi:CubicO group peptidase (beta-lactamase class C family)
MKRARHTLAGAMALIIFGLLTACGGGSEPRSSTPTFNANSGSIPISGSPVAGVELYDQAITGLMQKWNLPGTAFAVAKDGKLILARGYGYSDFEARHAMQPDSMFRIASISKTITAAAILQLVDLGLLDLDRPFLEVLTGYHVQTGGDPRLSTITLRHLLQHSGGWDRTVAPDPVFDSPRIASALGVPTPITCTHVVQFMMSQPLQFQPGTRVEYSNVGACFLARVVERVTGMNYEHYVRNHVLAPMDIYAMSIGFGQAARRGPYEVKYYMNDGAPLLQSMFPSEGRVSAPYVNDMITFEASGGWIGSAIDLTRLMTAIDGSRMRFLSDTVLARMAEDPHLPGLGATYWFGLGVLIGPTPTTWSKGGLLPGSQSLLVRNRSGYTWAFITNGAASNTSAMEDELIATVGQPLIDGIAGSTVDLYPQFASPPLPARTQ